MKTINALLAVVLATGYGVAHTQPFQLLDEVVVTASRIEEPRRMVTSYIESFSSSDIRDSGASSIPEFLSKEAGLNVRTTNSGALGVLSTVDLRGFGASAKDNTLILLDGEILNPIDGGSVRWETVPLDLIDRIEILHGSGSVQYGDRAVGGAVNIITRKPQSNQANTTFTVGSFGRLGFTAKKESTSKDNNFLISLSTNNDDGWRENSQASESLARVRLLHRLSHEASMDLVAAYSSQRYSSPGGVLGEANQGNRRLAKFNNVDDRTKTKQSTLSAGFSRQLGQGWAMEARLGGLESDQYQVTPFSTTAVKNIQYDKSGENASIKISRTNDFGTQSILGVDWSRSEALYRPNTGDVQNAKLEDLSFFVSHRRMLGENWLGTGGFRVQEQTATAFDLAQDVGETRASNRQYGRAGHLGFSYLPDNSSIERVSVNFSRAYRFANTDEFWSDSYGPAPNYTRSRVFSGILRPQRSDGADLVIEGRGNIVKTSATLFTLRTTDEIRYCVSQSCGFGSNVNSDDINRYGVSGRVWTDISPKVQLGLGGTLQSTRFSAGEFKGKRVALTPTGLFNSSLDWLLDKETRATFRVRYLSRQVYEGDETNSLGRIPAYAITDIQIRTKKSQWTISAGVNNLFDKRYATFGGYGFVSLTPSSSGNSYFYYPGEPLSAYLTVSRKLD
jgi:iron complex outermembrane receptor protein